MEHPNHAIDKSASREARRLDAEKLLQACVSHSEIMRTLADKYGVATQTIRRDIKVVYARWDQDARDHKPHERSQMRETLKRIIRGAMQDKKYNAAVAACDRLMKLDGLYAPDRIEVTHTTEESITAMLEGLSADDREKLRDLMRKAQERQAEKAGEVVH